MLVGKRTITHQRNGLTDRLLVLSLSALLLLSALPAHAAPKRGLVVLSDIAQSIGTGYAFDRNSTEGDALADLSSTSQRFDAAYAFDMDYSVYSKRYLTGKLRTEFDFTRAETDSATSAGDAENLFRIQYSVTGELFKKSSTPIIVSASSITAQSHRRFAGTYTVDADTQQVIVPIVNAFVPAQLGYVQQQLETKGLGDSDGVQNSSSFYMSADNTVRLSRVSSATKIKTNFQTLDFVAANLPDRKHYDTISASAANVLSWEDKGRARSFATSYSLADTVGTRQSRNTALIEQAAWDFGRRLTSRFSYENSTEDIDQQKQHLQRALATLRHTLFDSLTTELTLGATRNEINDGVENITTSGIALSYRKKLPADSALTLATAYSYGTTDRDLPRALLTIFGEAHTVPTDAPFEILLGKEGIVPSSIQVFNATRTMTLTFTIRQEGPATFISLPANPGESILVDYRYAIDPTIKFATTNISTEASVSLYGGLYRFSVAYSTRDQKLLEGGSSISNLTDSSTFRVRFDATPRPFRYGAEFLNFTSPYDRHNSFEGYLTYGRYFANRSVTASLRDRYSQFSSGQGDSNELFLNAVYAQKVFTNTVAKFSGDYIQTLRRQSGLANALTAGLELTYHTRKLNISLLASTNWAATESGTTQSQHIGINLVRSF
jgi:hypothetical protein